MKFLRFHFSFFLKLSIINIRNLKGEIKESRKILRYPLNFYYLFLFKRLVAIFTITATYIKEEDKIEI